MDQHLDESHVVAGTTPTTAPENKVFYPALDGFRAIAFFLVFLQHYLSFPWGNSGVNAFFVLSGFLITGILLDTRTDPHRARNFYVRRTLRIFPIYYLIFLLLWLSTPLFHWRWSIYWFAWPLYLGNFLRFLNPSAAQRNTPLQSAADGELTHSLAPKSAKLHVGHFWSLCVEEQFYLLWPWIIFWVPSRRVLLWLCATVVLALPLLRVLLQPHLAAWLLNEEFFYRLLPFQLDSLLLGALLAILWRGQYRDILLRIASVLAPALVLGSVGIFLLYFIANHGLLHGIPMPPWRWTLGLTLTNVIASAVMIRALQPGNWIYKVLCWRSLRYVGRISYGAYIYHDIFHTMMTGYLIHLFPSVETRHITSVVALPALVLTLVVSSLSYRFIESPFLNLKERWTIRAAAARTA